jgi:hypothetical protein
MAKKNRITEEERKMAFDGIVPPGRTEEWRKYFVRRQKWEAKRKEAGKSAPKKEKAPKPVEQEKPVEVEVASESVIIGG